MGATAAGRKELIAVVDGFRESKQSWQELLLDLKQRGLSKPPKLAHDLLCTASLLHPRTLSSPHRGTRILSQDLDQDLGRGSEQACPSGLIADLLVSLCYARANCCRDR